MQAEEISITSTFHWIHHSLHKNCRQVNLFAVICRRNYGKNDIFLLEKIQPLSAWFHELFTRCSDSLPIYCYCLYFLNCTKTYNCLVNLAVLLPQIQWSTLKCNGTQYIDNVFSFIHGCLISEFGGRAKINRSNGLKLRRWWERGRISGISGINQKDVMKNNV